MNVLVGANNSGKSTVISAFRTLAQGLRKAKVRSAEMVSGPDGRVYGHIVNTDLLPMSVENVHTDYNEAETTIKFNVTGGGSLVLYFPPDEGCILIPQATGKPPRRPSEFKKLFPLSIGVVPVLGPVEHEEPLVQEITVRRELETHRASRHFRNYWFQSDEGFEEFANLVESTWPGMSVERPFRPNSVSKELAMFCLEGIIPRELYWSGFGFQVWCQMLTHIQRASDDDILVIDEPDIYLHPDVQRQLVAILRDAGPDIVLATHSSEIVSEAEPSEIVLIDKSKRSAKRLRDVEGVQQALNSLGSIQNITLTQLAKNKRLLFVEGPNDFKRIRRFAKRLGYEDLAAGLRVTPTESGGFASWQKLESVAWGFEKAMGAKLKLAAVYDRDFWCPEEIGSITARLDDKLDFVHVHERKELENYLLIPAALQRAANTAARENARRQGNDKASNISVDKILDRITSKMRHKCMSQYISKRQEYFRKESDLDPSTSAEGALEWFDSSWADLETRMKIVPGKQVLSQLRQELQATHGVSLTDYRIIDSVRRDEVPEDLVELVKGLDRFAKSRVR